MPSPPGVRHLGCTKAFLRNLFFGPSQGLVVRSSNEWRVAGNECRGAPFACGVFCILHEATRPRILICPSVCVVTRERILSKVDLPAPFPVEIFCISRGERETERTIKCGMARRKRTRPGLRYSFLI